MITLSSALIFSLALFIDHSVFANSAFDANDYANAVLAGDTYLHETTRPTKVKTSENTKEDISVAISKLSFGIDDAGKQIKALVGDFQTNETVV